MFLSSTFPRKSWKSRGEYKMSPRSDWVTKQNLFSTENDRATQKWWKKGFVIFDHFLRKVNEKFDQYSLN